MVTAITWRLLILVLPALPSLAMSADDPEDLVVRYRNALEYQDAGSLSRLIDPGAEIRLRITQPGSDPLVVTLTPDEYLQQMRALWRFSQAEEYALSDIRHDAEGDSQSVTLTQKETYQLFGKTLQRDSRIRTRLKHTPDGWLITDLEAFTTER